MNNTDNKKGVTFVNGSVVFWDAKSKVRLILEWTKRVDCDSHYAYLLNVLLKKLKLNENELCVSLQRFRPTSCEHEIKRAHCS